MTSPVRGSIDRVGVTEEKQGCDRIWLLELAPGTDTIAGTPYTSKNCKCMPSSASLHTQEKVGLHRGIRYHPRDHKQANVQSNMFMLT
jgi:hypothetical protein